MVGTVSLAVAGVATAVAKGSFGAPIIVGAVFGVGISMSAGYLGEKMITGAPMAFKSVAGCFK